MNHALIFGPSLLGFAVLALATERQQDIQLGHALAPRCTRALRLAGWASLLLALAAAVGRQGWALGLVSYSGHTSLSAGLVFMALLLRERLTQPQR
ncbi:MAG: DUF3325 family protein [Hylemonella sp.]|uniref:DUF3325 family protein n=1 Tax=Hylemonella sp. TaxID=2066020 RepID=UPI0022BBE258|nr:DUF3325 family protein [Hylemonella sp.]MCZ8254019.1 DUF3325 family protein [Hylemonella sp.]